MQKTFLALPLARARCGALNAKIAKNPTAAKYPLPENKISLIMRHIGVDAPFNDKEDRNKQKAFIQIQ